MEYIKGTPYFCKTKDKIKSYPYLKNNLKCKILIIGGGIDGAIANYYLSKKYDVALVDKSRFGYSCTSCATALLEYQLDEYASDLLKYMSEEEIITAYKIGLNSISEIESFIKKYGNLCQFAKRPTLLFTSKNSEVKNIEEEYEFRKKFGFSCKLITEGNNPFPFKIKAGILANNGGCEFNPYLFTKQMIENSSNQDKLFENTDINKLTKIDGGYIATTNFGEEITCEKVIIATGFNWEILNKDDLCERFITYTIVTNPIEDFTWHKKALIHDAISPYHYLRLLPDKRIIFGGADTTFKMKPINDNDTNKIYKQLEESLYELFPDLQGKINIDYKFCGAFGTTPNNLGLIGTSGIDEDILLFISCGANGIINAIAGAKIIDDILSNKHNNLIKLFSPQRK